MLRIAIILIIVCLLFRWAFGAWPWQTLGGRSARNQALYRARKLLGVQSGASRDEIIGAHRRIVALVHPDRGGSSAAVHEANDARDLLLNELPDRGAIIESDRNTGSRDDDPSQD